MKKETKFVNKEFINYYAITYEGSYYVKPGAIEKIPNDLVEETLKTRKYHFPYTFNMHFEDDYLDCGIIKETVIKKYEIIK